MGDKREEAVQIYYHGKDYKYVSVWDKEKRINSRAVWVHNILRCVLFPKKRLELWNKPTLQ